jgi:hypothetical protein
MIQHSTSKGVFLISSFKKYKNMTAVEWLAEKYDYVYWMVKRDEIPPALAEIWKKGYLDQAKSMEATQSEEAYERGFNKGCKDKI